jgi:uncharacterized membrane protein
MDDAREFLVGHWLSLVLVIPLLLLGLRAVLGWRQKGRFPLAPALLAGSLSCLVIGDLALPPQWAFWLGAGALAAIFVMVLVLLVTAAWSAHLGFILGAAILIGVGGATLGPIGAWLIDFGKTIFSLEAAQPWWLLLLALVPLIVLLSYRSLAGLGPVRRWLAIALRSSLIVLLTLALAEVRLRRHNENVTVFFVVDRSFSIPTEFAATSTADASRTDLREKRVENFINETVARRGPGHRLDSAGLILFGRRPRLEYPASNAPSFNFQFKDAASKDLLDPYYTDIAAAIKLALASFPEGAGKRIVLISDGNENLGNAEEQARIAERNGAQIDVVPLAAGYRSENEVLVERVEAPPKTEQGARLPIRVRLRSYHPRPVYGRLTLEQKILQAKDVLGLPVPGSPAMVRLQPGLNTFTFQQPLANQQQSYTYEAIFEPEGTEDEHGKQVKGLEGDRVQNNSATTHVVALGQRRILIVENKEGEHQLLVDRLQAVGNSKYKVLAVPANKLPENKTDLGVLLSNYDCVILANLPAEALNEDQQEMIRSNTHDQGCGLIMIGGPDSFGAGGWQGTAVEKALPVDCDIKSYKVKGKGGLVLIMHASEMADGNRWQKDIAKLAIKKLSPADEVGILHFDWGGHRWHIPLQQIGNKRNTILGMVDRLVPGDMPDFDGPLKMAHDSLTEPERKLAVRHVIIISDGDPILSNPQLLKTMQAAKVTVSTVGVATHGPSQDQSLQKIATSTGGKFHKVTNPRALPQIYTEETRIVSQSFLFEEEFGPRLAEGRIGGPAEKVSGTLPKLYGFVRTTPKSSQLVGMDILGPSAGDFVFPILAHWPYGLGKAVAFTSDARSGKETKVKCWDRDWADSDMYSKFWEQVVDWALRPTESGRLIMTTDYHDGKVKITIDARDDKNRPLTDLALQGGITTPSPKPEDTSKLALKFEQKNSGFYEAEFPADQAGSYFVNAQAKRTDPVTKKEEVDSIRSGVTIPYSPEFADFESNSALLEKLREMTGGQTISEDLLAKAAEANNEAAIAQAKLAEEVFRTGLPQFRNLQPVWHWLILLTTILLFFDVAVRRIAIQPAEVLAASQSVWGRLRGRTAQAVQVDQFIDRLQSRKAKVSETLDQLRAAKRFEPGEGPVAVLPADREGVEAAAAPPRTAPVPRIAPQKEEEKADYASRLLKAKKKVWEERDKEK